MLSSTKQSDWRTFLRLDENIEDTLLYQATFVAVDFVWQSQLPTRAYRIQDGVVYDYTNLLCPL